MLTHPTEPDPLRRCRVGKEHHRRWQAGQGSPEQVGCHQHRGREPLRIRLPPQLPPPHPPAGPRRDDVADPLRGLPCQAASRPQGEQRAQRRFAADQPFGRPGAEPRLATDDDERILGRRVCGFRDDPGAFNLLARVLLWWASAGGCRPRANPSFTTVFS